MVIIHSVLFAFREPFPGTSRFAFSYPFHADTSIVLYRLYSIGE